MTLSYCGDFVLSFFYFAIYIVLEIFIIIIILTVLTKAVALDW